MNLPSFPLNRFCPLTELGACRQRSFVFSAAAELAPRAFTRRSQPVSILQTSDSRSEIAKLSAWPRNSRKSSSVLWLKSQFADKLARFI